MRLCAGSAGEGARDFAGRMLVSARDWLETTFASRKAHGVIAPWVLHTGLGPEAAASGYMAQVIAVAVQEGGMPIPRRRRREARRRARVVHPRARRSVRDRRERRAGLRGRGARRGRRTDRCAPRGDLQRHADAALRRAARRPNAAPFRYGRSEMQIHFALSEPPKWEGDERLGRTAIVHLTPGLDGVSRAVNEAERGLLPAEATVVVGQPLTMDPSRAPDGKGLLWVQLQELPWQVKGDAAGELDAGDGVWTADLRERYADRIQARIARHIPNLESSIAEAGRPLAGRPLERECESRPRRPVWRLARTRPELPLACTAPDAGEGHLARRRLDASRPGLGGGSGALVAQQLLEQPLTKRLASRFSR